MAVPSSGALSLYGIRHEIYDNNYNGSVNLTNISLRSASEGAYGTINTNNAASDRPDGSTPHAMSEFYNYDHDAAASLVAYSSTVNGQLNGSNACSDKTSTTYYHNGSGQVPAVNDNCYSNAGGTIPLGVGYYRAIGNNTYYGITGTQGLCNFAGGACGRSERSLKYNIEFIGNSPMGIPMYHFNYKDKSHGEGRFIGTMIDDLQRLGFNDAVIQMVDGEVWVDYGKIDVPYKAI